MSSLCVACCPLLLLHGLFTAAVGYCKCVLVMLLDVVVCCGVLLFWYLRFAVVCYVLLLFVGVCACVLVLLSGVVVCCCVLLFGV